MPNARVLFGLLLVLAWGWIPLLLAARPDVGTQEKVSIMVGILVVLMLLGVPAVIRIKSLHARGWNVTAIVVCVFLLWNAIGGLIGVFAGTWEGAWRWTALTFLLIYAALATASLLALHHRWDRSVDEARRNEQRELERIRRLGGQCPRCGGKGVIRPHALVRAAAALAGAEASSRGLPMTARRVVAELDVKCPACHGAGRFEPARPDAPASEPSRA